MQTLAMPADTNPNGDIFAGWLISQMDLAGAILAQRLAKCRVTTVAAGSMVFMSPVPVGSTVSCYAQCLDTGNSSIRIRVEVWQNNPLVNEELKVTEGEFVYVAIDGKGRTRSIAD